MKHVALLRGINVGGKGRLPMRELVAIFAAAGAQDVSTYIQSGNVLFSAREPERVCRTVTAEIVRVYGYPGTIVLRSEAELAKVCNENPFLSEAIAPEWLHVCFLASAPAAEQVAKLDPQRSPGDRFVVIGREIYMHMPNGMGRTKLSGDYMERMLQTTGTVRNWKTVTKLLALLQG